MASIGNVMSSNLVTVDPACTLAEAATVMGTHRVGSALVMEDDALVGIFTERDVVRALSQDSDAPRHPVSDWMTRNPVTTQPQASVEDALERMHKGGFRHLPVLDGQTVVGVVSMRDLSRFTTEG